MIITIISVEGKVSFLETLEISRPSEKNSILYEMHAAEISTSAANKLAAEPDVIDLREKRPLKKSHKPILEGE